jgi:hypothetical protein
MGVEFNVLAGIYPCSGISLLLANNVIEVWSRKRVRVLGAAGLVRFAQVPSMASCFAGEHLAALDATRNFLMFAVRPCAEAVEHVLMF